MREEYGPVWRTPLSGEREEDKETELPPHLLAKQAFIPPTPSNTAEGEDEREGESALEEEEGEEAVGEREE